MVLVDGSTCWSRMCLLTTQNAAFSKLLVQIFRLNVYHPSYSISRFDWIRLENSRRKYLMTIPCSLGLKLSTQYPMFIPKTAWQKRLLSAPWIDRLDFGHARYTFGICLGPFNTSPSHVSPPKAYLDPTLFCASVANWVWAQHFTSAHLWLCSLHADWVVLTYKNRFWFFFNHLLLKTFDKQYLYRSFGGLSLLCSVLKGSPRQKGC